MALISKKEKEKTLWKRRVERIKEIRNSLLYSEYNSAKCAIANNGPPIGNTFAIIAFVISNKLIMNSCQLLQCIYLYREFQQIFHIIYQLLLMTTYNSIH